MAILLSSGTEAATILATVSGPTTVNIGDMVTVDLSITGWADGDVDAIALNVGFDQNVISYQGGAILTTEAGSFLNHNQQVGAIIAATLDTSNVAGGVFGFEVEDTDIVSSPNTGATQASGNLGSLTFRADNVGMTTVIGSNATFLEPFDIPAFFGSAITPSSLSYSGVDITVVVPEPTPALLLLVGITLTGCLRRSRSTPVRVG